MFYQLVFLKPVFQYAPGKCEIDVRLRSFSQNGMIRNGRPRSDCFITSEAQKTFSYSREETAMESSLTSSPSSEPLIPDKGWSKKKKTVVFVNLDKENMVFSSSSSSECFTSGKVWFWVMWISSRYDKMLQTILSKKCLPRQLHANRLLWPRTKSFDRTLETEPDRNYYFPYPGDLVTRAVQNIGGFDVF